MDGPFPMAMLNSQRVMLNINHVLKYSNFDHPFVHQKNRSFENIKLFFVEATSNVRFSCFSYNLMDGYLWMLALGNHVKSTVDFPLLQNEKLVPSW